MSSFQGGTFTRDVIHIADICPKSRVIDQPVDQVQLRA